MDDPGDVDPEDNEKPARGPLFSFDDASPMPHWSEPATGEMPIIDTSSDSSRGGSRLFPQLPDDPNLIDDGQNTGVLEAIDVPEAPDVPETTYVESSSIDVADSPTGIDLGGSLAGGFDEPAPTASMEDVFGSGVDLDDLDGDLPAPRWGAATTDAAEGFLGDVDPEALAAVVGTSHPESEFDGPGAEFARRGDEFVDDDVVDTEVVDTDAGVVDADFAGDDLNDLDELIQDATPKPYINEARLVPDDEAASSEPAQHQAEAMGSEPEAMNAWSALEDPSPVWREGAQDYETHRAADEAAERMVLHMPSQGSTKGETETPSSGRNMPVAIGVGLAIAGAFLALVDQGPGYGLIMIVPLLVLAASEFFVSVRKVGYRPATLLGLATVAGLPLAAYWRGPEAILLVLTISMIFSLLWYLFGVELDRPTANVSVTMVGIMWVGLLGAHIPLILELPHGSGIFLGAVIGTVTYDVAGLFIGRATGQSRLAPNISPNKTYEGLIGGMIVSILVVTFGLGLAPGLAPWDLNQVDALLLGIVVAVVAPLGDLAQSMIKRDLDIKDMGTALPGHGGVFDRFDALLFVIPAVYYLALARDLNVIS